MDDNSAEVSANLERAETNLRAAKDLIEKQYFDIAAARAYYSAFYAARALLLSMGIDTSKHSGVIALIHQNFVKTGKLEKEQGRNLNWLFEVRGVGDYGVTEHVAAGEAYRSVSIAEKFLKSVKEIL
jgi:uncharacterized protein (UPF0332 family)